MKKLIMMLLTLSIVTTVVVVPRIFNKNSFDSDTTAYTKSPISLVQTTESESTTEFSEKETVLSVEAEDGTLTWSEIPGVSVYSIYRSTSKDDGYQKIGVSNDNSYVDASSMPGVTYYYKYGYEVPQQIDESSSLSTENRTDMTTVTTTTATTARARTVVTTKTQNVITTKVTTTKKSVTNTTVSTSAKMVTGFEQHMLDLINAEREAYGVSPLSFDPQLTKLAQIRAAELTVYYSPDHYRPDNRWWDTVFDDYNYSFYYAGENIAYRQRNADEVMNSWIASPGHHANIVSSNYGHVGLACYKKNGELYWEQLFTN